MALRQPRVPPIGTPPNWSVLLEPVGGKAWLTLANALTVLEHDPFAGPERIWSDGFLSQIRAPATTGLRDPRFPMAREWSEEDTFALTVHIQQTTPLKRISPSIIAQAVQLVAARRECHVVRDWLDKLVWDTIPRIDQAFEDHWGVECNEQQPCEYVRSASKNFFIGLVARIYRPGCQLDTMVVFEGGQGVSKTSALRALADPWYAVAAADVYHKDFFEGLRGKLIIEIGELDSFSRVEVTRVKTVVSTPVDRYRPSYGHYAKDFPRQCVFAGTTNRDDWGNDETGLRRFWPLKCGDIHVDTLLAARDQLFAEAIVRLKAGESWWEMPVVTLSIQAMRQHDDAWSNPVLTWAESQLLTRSWVEISEVAAGALKIPLDRLDKSAQMRLARILRLAKWERRRIRQGSDLVWGWSNTGFGQNSGNIF